MQQPVPLRPELASVCRYQLLKQSARTMPPASRLAPAGVLADLAAARGLQ